MLLGGHKPSNDRVCERRAGAEVCLVANGPAYRIEGKGFVPGDDVHIKFTGEDPFFLRADAAAPLGGCLSPLKVVPDSSPARVLHS